MSWITTPTGLRSATHAEARSHLRRVMATYRLRLLAEDLADHCDLGFHVACFHGPSLELAYTKQSNRHYGKGTSAEEAELSGWFEAIERISSIPVDPARSARGPRREVVRGREALDPAQSLLPVPRHVPGLEHYSADVTSTYSEDLALDWYEGFSLRDGRPVWVPRCLTHTLRVDDPVNRYQTNRPNGLAAGLSREEALVSALLEVIERDATCIFTGNSLPCPEVIPASIEDPLVQAFLEQAHRRRVEVVIKNITTDLGIPTLYTQLVDARPDRPLVSWGIGCHLSRDIALLRSVTEACQDRAARLARYERLRNLRGSEVPAGLRWEVSFGREVLLGQRPDTLAYVWRHLRRQPLREVDSLPIGTPAETLACLLQRLMDAGVEEVLAADLTCLDVPVFRVIVPELEFIPRFFYERCPPEDAPRRLDRVPARVGYVAGRDFASRSGPANNLLI